MNDITIKGVMKAGSDSGIISSGDVTTSGVTFLNTSDITINGPVKCVSMTNPGTSTISATTSGIVCNSLYVKNGIITNSNITLPTSTYKPIIGQLGYTLPMSVVSTILTTSTYPLWGFSPYMTNSTTTGDISNLSIFTGSVSSGTWLFHANIGFTLFDSRIVGSTTSGITQIGVYLGASNDKISGTTVSGVFIKTMNMFSNSDYTNSNKTVDEEMDITQVIINTSTVSKNYYLSVFNGGGVTPVYNPKMSFASFTRIA
jgi:hypothetical protein